LNAAGDTCLAAENYAAVQQLFADAQVADLLAAAQASCALTPSPAPTDDSATPIP
jgi:hypothetical protein